MSEKFRGESSPERSRERGAETGSSSDSATRLLIEVAIDPEEPTWHRFAVQSQQLNSFDAAAIEYELDSAMNDVIYAVVDEGNSFGVLFDSTRDDITEAWLDVMYTIGIKLGFELSRIDVIMTGDPDRRVVSLQEIFHDFSGDEGSLLRFPAR